VTQPVTPTRVTLYRRGCDETPPLRERECHTCRAARRFTCAAPLQSARRAGVALQHASARRSVGLNTDRGHFGDTATGLLQSILIGTLNEGRRGPAVSRTDVPHL
jgi:hypothetical protein